LGRRRRLSRKDLVDRLSRIEKSVTDLLVKIEESEGGSLKHRYRWVSRYKKKHYKFVPIKKDIYERLRVIAERENLFINELLEKLVNLYEKMGRLDEV